VKIVGGSEIYNFPIHHFVHFYSRVLRKTGSNRGSPQRRRQNASTRAPRRRPRTTSPPLGVRSRRRAFPRPPAPSRGHGSPPDALNAENASCSAPPVRAMPWTSGLSPVLLPGAPAKAARALRGSRPTPQHSRAMLPLPRPPIKATHQRPVRARHCQPQHAPASCPCTSSRAPPFSSSCRPVQRLPSSPTQLPNRSAPPRPLPDRSTTGVEPHRSQPAWAPPAGRPPVFSHPSAATNRTLVTSSTFSTHPAAETPTGVAQFRRVTPAGPPRDHIAKRNFFPRASLQLITQIVKVLWLYLVNCVENHRKLGKMQNQFFWILCELSYNFCYSCLS
jgi:hypothetical protein